MRNLLMWLFGVTPCYVNEAGEFLPEPRWFSFRLRPKGHTEVLLWTRDVEYFRQIVMARETRLEEITRLRSLLRRWVVEADAGKIDGVDLNLLAESEAALKPPGGE